MNTNANGISSRATWRMLSGAIYQISAVGRATLYPYITKPKPNAETTPARQINRCTDKKRRRGLNTQVGGPDSTPIRRHVIQ